MSDEGADARRVRFYGIYDLATGLHVSRVATLVEQFDPNSAPTSTVDILELHNVQKYLEHGILPDSYSEEERSQAVARIPQIHSAVARFFSTIDNKNIAAMVTEVGYDYHSDLLELLGRNRVFERCDGATVLDALRAAGVPLGVLLASKKLTRTYDAEMRDELRASPRSAEHLVRKYLQDDVREDIHLPLSFTQADARELLERYIESKDANPNYLRLIVTAKEGHSLGIDAKLRLRAKRRDDELVAEFFDESKGFRTGCEVSITGTQDEPVVFEMDTSDGSISRYTYSSRWLEETLDNSSILNNFLHLFDFADHQVLLVLPSYPAHLGVIERFVGTTGKAEYRTGAVFRAIDMSTLMQTRMYYHFLQSRDIDLEQVVSWFFQEYICEEFGAANFSFNPSDSGTPYLQRVRNLFAEMEGVAGQFTLFVNNGELDRDLLAIGSEQTLYKEIPSLLEGKYVYPCEGEEIAGILFLLFSDQSMLSYINEDLKADNAAKLLLGNQVAYDQFKDYQKPDIDHLMSLGVLEDTGTCVQFASVEQFLILYAISTTQAASYYRLSDAGRAEADAMEAKGWVTRVSSLLTEAEAEYFNYFLNGVDFSNGPKLRNKYLHGSQANADGEDAHFRTYITALRLTVAMVIKMNDDYCLSASEKVRS